MLIFFLQGNSCKNRIGYDRYCEIRKEIEDIALIEDPKDLKCCGSARKLALDVVEVITKKQK